MRKKQVSKDFLNYLRWLVINSKFSYYLLVILLVSRDSVSLILKENKFHICVLTTSTRGVFRTQPNVYDRLLPREQLTAKSCYFRKNAPSQMFDWVLNTSLVPTIFYFRKSRKGNISSLRTYYSNELKKSSASKKMELGWMTPTS